jgi:hypothetical protein
LRFAARFCKRDRLDSLSAGQTRILDAIAAQHSELETQFRQVPNGVKLTDILTTIDSFWGRFNAAMNPDTRVTDVDLENFARDVMKAKLHVKLGELNSLLANPIDNAQPVLQFPFYQFRQKNSLYAPPEAFPGRATYDFAEKKFAYYRAEQQKGYLIYLWAAEIIQSKCEVNGDARCSALPMTSTAFKSEYERYGREQVRAFGAGAIKMVLAYSRPDSDTPRFLLSHAAAEEILARVSYLTSTVFGDAEGAWGQVVTTEGDPWDGKISLLCGGTRSVLQPVLSYNVAADTKYGPAIDWWTSRGRNGIYDEVHFASNWRIHHYNAEKKTLGACRIEQKLPSNEMLPWTSDQGEIVNVTKNGTTFPVGFFYALKRAGGTWAMASGQNWDIPASPETADSGVATKQETRFDWVISPAHHEGLWAAMLNMARVDHTVGKSIVNNNQEAKVTNRIYAYNRKPIFFPEGGTVKVRLSQHPSCEKMCRDGLTSELGILDYDIEHSPFEKGKLTAVVAVFLDPKQGKDNIDARAKNGIYIDASYGETSDRKTHRTASEASGTARVTPGQAYHLQYYINFDLVTHSKRLDPTRYRFMGKVTPLLLFVTR